jgi:ABC-type phosphate transport system substrate-binding protein
VANATALADVVAVVSAQSPVEHLSKQQLADIFLGRTARLPSGEPVVPIDQEEGSPARDEFYLIFVAKTPAQLRAHWSKIIFTGRGKPPQTVPDGSAARELVIANPRAITYLDRSQLNGAVKAVRID